MLKKLGSTIMKNPFKIILTITTLLLHSQTFDVPEPPRRDVSSIFPTMNCLEDTYIDDKNGFLLPRMSPAIDLYPQKYIFIDELWRETIACTNKITKDLSARDNALTLNISSNYNYVGALQTSKIGEILDIVKQSSLFNYTKYNFNYLIDHRVKNTSSNKYMVKFAILENLIRMQFFQTEVAKVAMQYQNGEEIFIANFPIQREENLLVKHAWELLSRFFYEIVTFILFILILIWCIEKCLDKCEELNNPDNSNQLFTNTHSHSRHAKQQPQQACALAKE